MKLFNMESTETGRYELKRVENGQKQVDNGQLLLEGLPILNPKLM